MEAPDEEKKKKHKKIKIEFDTNKCWFCLASPSVEKHLIISVGNAAYLVLAKGKKLKFFWKFYCDMKSFEQNHIKPHIEITS